MKQLITFLFIGTTFFSFGQIKYYYTYDDANRLIQANDGIQVTNYYYDDNGNRVNQVSWSANIKVIDSVRINFKVYPNPTTSKFTVDFEIPLSVTGEITVALFNIEGKILDEYKADKIKKITRTWDITNYPTGVYFIKVYSKNTSSVFKLEKF